MSSGTDLSSFSESVSWEARRVAARRDFLTPSPSRERCSLEEPGAGSDAVRPGRSDAEPHPFLIVVTVSRGTYSGSFASKAARQQMTPETSHMLNRSVLACALAFATAPATRAQTGTLNAITAPVKDAGTYHVDTGTWTRNTSAFPLAGPKQLYDNTCTVGYYSGVTYGTTVGDSGRIPSLNSGGLANCYEVTFFSFAYCTYEPLVTSLGLRYYETYAACDGLASATPLRAFALLNLPGGGVSGSQGCWIITVDLTNTTISFDLAGDRDTVFDNVPSLDHFGWSWLQLIPTTGSNAGPILAGDPLGNFNQSCGMAVHPSGQGAGTDHYGWGPASGPGSGIGTLDQYELQGAGSTGCFWFGGYNSSVSSNPLGAFYHKLWGGEGGGCSVFGGNGIGQPFCFGSFGNCPGGEIGGAGAGCPHQSGPNGSKGARLQSTGEPRFSNDTYGFHVTAGPSTFGILIQGASAISYPTGNHGVPDSAGLFCVAPQMRGNIEVMNLGAGGDEALIDQFQGQPFGATAQPLGSSTYNQFWFRDNGNPQANPGPGAEFNFSNAVETDWLL